MEWCGPERLKKLRAVAPGAATGELIDKLRASPKAEWYRVCSEHAKERAEEICDYFKDGDLWNQKGEYIWVIYWPEIRKAMQSVGAGRVRQWKAVDAAGITFIETVERIRDRRLGTPEERAAKEQTGLDDLERSETVEDFVERYRREQGVRHDGCTFPSRPQPSLRDPAGSSYCITEPRVG
jgi:hypothetical protein